MKCHKECDLGELVQHNGILGHWVFEPCPYHYRTTQETEECSVCDSNGEVEIFIECSGEEHQRINRE